MAGEEGTHRRWICPERTRGKGFTGAGERTWGERERPQGSNVRGGPRRRGTGQARGIEKGAERERLFQEGREAGLWLEKSVVPLFVFSKEETTYRLRGKSRWRGWEGGVAEGRESLEGAQINHT